LKTQACRPLLQSCGKQWRQQLAHYQVQALLLVVCLQLPWQLQPEPRVQQQRAVQQLFHYLAQCFLLRAAAALLLLLLEVAVPSQLLLPCVLLLLPLPLLPLSWQQQAADEQRSPAVLHSVVRAAAD
jgi:hypothetical protein